MNKHLLLILMISITLNLTACSSIDFYEVNKDGTENEVGFLYYPPKPYLLVEQADKNITTKIISLPDTSRPHRVKQKGGWGTSDLSFTIKDGMIETFNAKTDSKGVETLTSIAGLGTAKAALDTAKSALITAEFTASSGTAKLTGAGLDMKVAIKYKVKSFIDSAEILTNDVIKTLKKENNDFKHQISSLKKVLTTIKNNTEVDYRTLNPDVLLKEVEKRRKLAKVLTTDLNNVSSSLAIYANNEADKPDLVLVAKEANTKLANAIKLLSAFSLRSSSVTGLYEINYINGRLQLNKVVLDR